VNREIPFKGLNWFFGPLRNRYDRNLERIKALEGGIAIQHRMAYQGEYFMERYARSPRSERHLCEGCWIWVSPWGPD